MKRNMLGPSPNGGRESFPNGGRMVSKIRERNINNLYIIYFTDYSIIGRPYTWWPPPPPPTYLKKYIYNINVS